MSGVFDAIGLSIATEEEYDRLVEYVSANGERTSIFRRGAYVHGRCLKLDSGLEIWATLYQSGSEIFCTDCRPAFRSQHISIIEPWELTEYDNQGGAVVSGLIKGTEVEAIFELQNLTEVGLSAFQNPSLNVSLAGLAYSARCSLRHYRPRFVLTELVSKSYPACENDYTLRGKALGWRTIRNKLTGNELISVYVDAVVVKLEVLVNKRDLKGELKMGATFSANIWLQGYVMDERAVEVYYEGVDRDATVGDFWAHLRREN